MTFIKNKWLQILLLLPFIKPRCFEYIPQLEFVDSVFDILRIISFVIIVFSYIINAKFSKVIISIILFELSLLFSTIINNGNYWKYLITCGSIIAVCMLTEVGIKSSAINFLSAVTGLLSFLITINFILLLIFPNGLAYDSYYYNKYNFLAIDNSLAQFIIPFITVIALYSLYKFNKISQYTWLMLIISSATMLITWSATGLVGWFIICFFIIFVCKRKYESLFNIKNLIITNIAFFFLIIIFRVQEWFSFIIVNVLHKSITFTGRTEIWDLSINLIKNSPLFGYGIYAQQGLIFWNDKYYYSHNGILELLLQGGIIALIFYIIIFILIANILMKYKEHCFAALLSASIFSFLTMMLMESHLTTTLFYCVLVIAYNIPELINQYEAYQNKKRKSSLIKYKRSCGVKYEN